MILELVANAGHQSFQTSFFEDKVVRPIPYANDVSGFAGILLALFLTFLPGYAASQMPAASWDNFVKARNDNRQADAKLLLDELAARGDPNGLARLAQVLRAGDAWYGGVKDLDRAFTLFEQAWAAGSPSGAHGIGYMYYKGESRPKDYTQALIWFGKGAEGGVDASYTMLGLMAQGGRGLAQDCKAAERHFIKAIELGSDAAKYSLGFLYDKGCPGFAAQPDKALQWMRESAKAGDDEAKAYVKAHETAAAPVNQPRALGQMGGGGAEMDRLFKGALLAAAEMGFKAASINNDERKAQLYRSYQGNEVTFFLQVPPRGGTVRGNIGVADDDIRTGFIRLYRQELAKQVGTNIELDGNISGR